MRHSVEGLRELGYVEGKNIAIEYRFAEGKEDRLRELAAELVRLKVDIIVAAASAAAAKDATKTIPIVFAAAADPVGKWDCCQPGAAGRKRHRADYPCSEVKWKTAGTT